MKKLSIIMALIMALSCFGLTAFAETSSEAAEATTAAPAKVTVTVNWDTLDDSVIDPVVLNYELAAGGTLTADDIIAAVKARLNDDGSKLVDVEEYVISEEVVTYDSNNPSGYIFKSVKVESGAEYEFDVYAVEINDLENFAQVLASEAAGLDWGGIASANVTLINQIISGLKAAIDSLVNADWPECTEQPEETTAEATEPVTTPDTGASAVAGAAVVVLALSAATAVVLRKKED